MKKIYSSIFVLMILTTFYACKNQKDKYTSPKGYDLTKPDKFNMPSSLLEISGVAFNNGISDTVYTIQDEDGKVFRQKWDVKKQKNTKFAPKGDYEDLAILNNQIFVLKSSGSIFSFPISETFKEETKAVKEDKHIVPEGEYESLFADPETNKIYILCKNCPVDKKAKTVTGYTFDYNTDSNSISPQGSFTVDLKQITALNPKLKSNLNPSALAKNPKTKEWYILSSMNKLLVVTDPNWKIKAVHRLNSSTFNQPEGIAFDKDLNLYISNEGDEITDGNVIKFVYVP